MPEFKNVTLTWPQLRKLEEGLTCIKVISRVPQRELKDGKGNVLIEWSETEVKFNLPE